MRCRPVLRAGVVMVVCAVLGVLVGAGSAAAHAVLISSDPGRGSVVATAPTTVSLTFSEPVVVAAEGIRVFGPDGARLDSGRAAALGRASTVGVGLRNGAERGTYTVAWRVMSADSHPVAGGFTFSVGHPSAHQAAGTAQSSDSTAIGVIYGIVRAAAFASFALLVGSIAFVLLCWPGAIGRGDVRRIMLVGWAGLVAATMVGLLLQGPYGYGLGADRIFDSAVFSATVDSRFGAALTGRLLLLALAGGYLVLLCAWLGHLARRGHAWFGALGVGLAVGLASTWAVAGHAAAGLQSALALPVDVVHLLAMGVWLGGLVTLAVILDPAAAASTEVSAAVYRFSSIATGSVVLLIGTGSYQSWRQLGSWAAFEATDYGRLLLVKLVIVALLLGVAVRSRRWATRHRRAPIGIGVGAASRSSPAVSTLRRSVLCEAVLGALVLGVTALLVNAEPGRTAIAASPSPAHQVISYDTGGPGGQGRLTVDVDPAVTGPVMISVTVQDSTAVPRDVAELNATLTLTSKQLGPFSVLLQRTAPGRYVTTGFQIPADGTWQLAVTVRTSDIDQTTVTTPINIG
ncbi:MAG TPA: copper resistance protein CopC [Pseudonocardiaceae bacterium]|nr:copper resistance protein CopC [Pseudonocardiaceae bacterium]